jgi:conjugal transfer/entry exclusion protein
MAQVYSVEQHIWKQVFRCLDKLENIANRMEGYANELDEMDREEQPKSKPVLRLVKK